MKLTKVAENPIQHVLLYGPPKVGKTQLTMGLTKLFNVLYIGCEAGHAVFFKLSPEQQERVEMLLLPDSRDWPVAIETVKTLLKRNDTGYNVCNQHGKIECHVCKAAQIKDNTVNEDGSSVELFTHINLYALDSSWVVVIDSSTQLTNSAIAHLTRLQPEDYKMQTDDWGNLSKLMEIIYSRIQVAPFHLVMISHETEADLEDGKTKLVPVAGSRNFSRGVAKYFDHVVYMQVHQGTHGAVSMTTQTMNIVVGSRTDIDIKKDFSLIPFFTGEIKKPEPAASIPNITPGQKAVLDLKAIMAKKG